MKWLLLLTIVGSCLFPDVGFAQGSDGTDLEKQMVAVADMLLRLLSWLWIVPAIIAGKLMTNDFVYGGVIHLQPYLWKMWQFMRTMANVTLGVIFVGYILKQFFKPGGAGEILGIVKKVVAAGILIQMSRWLMAVLIDFSTISIAAVSALPLQVMEKQFDGLKFSLRAYKRVEIQDGAIKDTNQLNDSENINYITELQTITPDADTVAGPLLFFGASVVNLFGEGQIEGGKSGGNEGKQRDWSQLTLTAFLKIIVLLLFTAPLIILMVVNAIRIFWIWIWVILSPFLVLHHIFTDLIPGSESASEKFKLSSILGLIFQPVAVIGMLSLSMILVIGVVDVLQGGDGYREKSLAQLNISRITDNSMTIGAGSTSELTVVGDLFANVGANVGGFIGQMIIVFFTVFLLWSLVKIGFSASKITVGIADKMYDFVGNSAQAIPIPGFRGMGIGGLKEAKNQLTQRAKNKMNAGNANRAQELTGPMADLFGLPTNPGGLTPNDVQELKNTYIGGTMFEKAQRFWGKMRSLSQDKQLTYQGGTREAIESWFNEGQGYEYMKNPAIGILDAATKKEDVSFKQYSGFANRVMTQGWQGGHVGKITPVSEGSIKRGETR